MTLNIRDSENKVITKKDVLAIWDPCTIEIHVGGKKIGYASKAYNAFRRALDWAKAQKNFLTVNTEVSDEIFWPFAPSPKK